MSYHSFSDGETSSSSEYPMRVVVSHDGRLSLNTKSFTPPRSPRIELDSAEESEYEISPPKDPILLHIVGAGDLATAPARIRFILSDSSDGPDGENSLTQDKGSNFNARLQPIEVEYFHPTMNGWCLWHPTVPNVMVKGGEEGFDGDDEMEEEGGGGGGEEDRQGKAKRKRPRWKRRLGIFREFMKLKRGKKGGKKDGDDDESHFHAFRFLHGHQEI